MPSSLRTARAFTRSTSKSRKRSHAATERRCDEPRRIRLGPVVLFYEILLVACTVVITWFALYAVYRLISDDS